MIEVGSLAGIDTVGDITRHHAKSRPDRAAIHFEGQRITFGELDRRAAQVANGLIAEGVKPQARIAYLSEKLAGVLRALVRSGKGRHRTCPCQLSPRATGSRLRGR